MIRPIRIGRFDGERKSRQFSASFKPSVFDAIQKIAYVNRMTVNNLLGEVMEQYVADNQELIAQYDKLTESEEEQQ